MILHFNETIHGTAAVSSLACPNTSGTEGHGDGIKYGNRHYYYHIGKTIPKDKIVALKWEGNWCGRVHGDVEYIIVAWNGTNFTIIGHYYSDIKNVLKHHVPEGSNNSS